MAKTIDIEIKENQVQGYQDRLCYWGTSTDVNSNYTANNVVGCDQGLSAEEGTDGNWIYRNRLVRYTIEIPAINKNENNETITKILGIKIRFTGGTFGVSRSNLDFVDKLSGKIYCYLSQDENAFLNRSAYDKDYAITYDVSESNFSNVQTGYITPKSELIPGTTYYLFVTADIANQNTWCFWGGESSAATATLTYETYTKCIAPTLIVADSRIITPQGGLTISWSGYQNGIQNSVIAFNVEFQVGSIVQIHSTDANSITLQIPEESNRGDRIYCKVQSLGTAEGFDSEYSERFEISRINSLPTTPTILLNGSNKLPSTSAGSVLAFKLIQGVDNDSDIQTITTHYSINDSSSKVVYTSDGIIIPETAGTYTYKFWAYDGLEYSAEPYIQNIIINSTPTVSANVSGTKLKIDGEVNDAYIISPKISLINGENGQASNNKYDYLVGFSDNADFSNPKWHMIFQDASFSTITISDIREYLVEVGQTLPCFYKISATRKDGIENSEPAISEVFQLTAPKVTKFSGFDGEDEAAWKGKCGKRLYLTLKEDEGYNILQLDELNYVAEIIENWTVIPLPDNESISKTWNIKGQAGLAQTGFMYNFILETEDEASSISQVQTLHLSNLILPTDENNTIKPFTNTANSFSLNPHGLTTDTMSNFGLNSIQPLFCLKEGSAFGPVKEVKVKGSSTGDILSFTIAPEEFYKAFPNGIDKNSASTFTFEIIFKTVFGENIRSTKDFIADFREQPTEVNLEIYPEGYEEYLINEWQFLKEGMNLKAKISFKTYNTNPVAQITWKGNKINNILTSSILFDNATLYYNNPVSCEQTIDLWDIAEKEFTSDDSLNFSIKITTDAGISFEEQKYSGIEIKRHTAPIVRFRKATYDGATKNTITAEWSISNVGYSDNIGGTKEKIEIKFEDVEENILLDNFEKGQSTIEASCEIGEAFYEKTYLHIAPKLYTVLSAKTSDGEITAFETYKTNTIYNYLTVYNIVPTVSYRHNYLGINVLPESIRPEAALTIGTYEGRKLICFSGDGLETTLDLKTGKLDGFVLDGGTWS